MRSETCLIVNRMVSVHAVYTTRQEPDCTPYWLAQWRCLAGRLRTFTTWITANIPKKTMKETLAACLRTIYINKSSYERLPQAYAKCPFGIGSSCDDRTVNTRHTCVASCWPCDRVRIAVETCSLKSAWACAFMALMGNTSPLLPIHAQTARGCAWQPLPSVAATDALSLPQSQPNK